MKNILPLIAVFAIFLLASCTQEYTCQCVVKYTGNPPGIPDSSIHEFAIRDKKSEAKSKCDENSVTVSQDNITMTEKCRLY